MGSRFHVGHLQHMGWLMDEGWSVVVSAEGDQPLGQPMLPSRATPV
ncbi:MAG: hypothetical protein OXC31_18320 [Spirochaetaceae bacterium]|nr:hypothetical protein [Spirochaetaceae bacterium]